MLVYNETLLSAGDMSQATLTSSVAQLTHMAMASVQAVFTGSPVGAIKLQATCSSPVTSSSAWTDIADSSANISAAGSVLWDIQDIGFSALRCVYTKTSGTGSLSIIANCKGA